MLIICCGMPRSGSTLQFNATWKVVEAAGKGSAVEWRSSDDWNKSINDLIEFADDADLHVVKMHFPSDELLSIAEGGKAVKFVYVHRDIRDVVVSMKVKFDFSLGRAVKRISESLSLEKRLSVFPSDVVLVQEYADLLNDLQNSISKIANFLGIEVDAGHIATIAKELDINVAYDRSRNKKIPFEHLRRRINRILRRKINFADEELMLHPEHVSPHKGRIGIWQDNLTQEELAELDRQFGKRLTGGFGA